MKIGVSVILYIKFMTLLTLIILSLLFISIMIFVIIKTITESRIRNSINNTQNEENSIETVNNYIDVSNKIIAYIDKTIGIEANKVILTHSRLGKAYNANNIAHDCEEIYNTVIDSFNDEILNAIVNMFGVNWLKSYVSSTSFLLLVEFTDNYNGSIIQ